jgi:hypothetical protein
MTEIYNSDNLTKIVTIQKLCIEKLFFNSLKKSSNIFNQLKNLINIEENENLFNNNIENFDKLTKYMMNKDIINNVSTFLKKYYRMVGFNAKSSNVISFQLTSRIFLSMYVIYGYPEIILSHKKKDILDRKVDPYDYDIYLLSENLFNSLNKIIKSPSLENKRKFIKSINMYSNCFLIWKNKDKIKKIRTLVNEWISLQETIDEINNTNSYSVDQKNKSIDELKKSQNNIYNLISKFKVNINENYLKNHYSICKQIKLTYEKSYWDLFESELLKEKYDFLKKILFEIQNNIIKLRKNNDFINQFKDKYDVDFIIQMIENKVFSPDNLISYSNYLVDLILKFEAPIRNNNTQEEWEEILNNISKSKLEDFNKNIIIILKFILKKIDEINNDIFNLYILDNL